MARRYVEIHLMVEERTLRDIRDMCFFKRMGGRDDLCSEAWIKVIKSIEDKKNAADLCLKEYKEDEYE